MIRAVKDEEHRGSGDVPQPSVGEIISRKEIKDNKKIRQWAQIVSVLHLFFFLVLEQGNCFDWAKEGSITSRDFGVFLLKFREGKTNGETMAVKRLFRWWS